MAKWRTTSRPNRKGRNPTSRFVRLDHSLLNSPAFCALTTTARALMIELAMLENGSNNGSLYLSIRDATARLGLSDNTAAQNAFNELQEMGFIEMTEAAHFHIKASEKSRARCWRLTWVPGPGRRGPSLEFKDREPPPQSKRRKGMERGLRARKAYRKRRDSGQFPVSEIDT